MGHPVYKLQHQILHVIFRDSRPEVFCKNLLLKLHQKSLKLIINIYFVSNDALLKFQGHLRIICYKLFGALRYFGETEPKHILNKVRESYIETHQRCLTQLFMLNEAILKCNSHELYLF